MLRWEMKEQQRQNMLQGRLRPRGLKVTLVSPHPEPTCSIHSPFLPARGTPWCIEQVVETGTLLTLQEEPSSRLPALPASLEPGDVPLSCKSWVWGAEGPAWGQGELLGRHCLGRGVGSL